MIQAFNFVNKEEKPWPMATHLKLKSMEDFYGTGQMGREGLMNYGQINIYPVGKTYLPLFLMQSFSSCNHSTCNPGAPHLRD